MQMGPETGPQVSEKQDRASDNRNKSSDSSDSLNNDDLEDNNMSSDNYNKENKHKEEEEADKGPAKQKCTLLFSTLQCQHILSNIYKKGITCCWARGSSDCLQSGHLSCCWNEEAKNLSQVQSATAWDSSNNGLGRFWTQFDLQIQDTVYPGTIELVYSKFEATYTIPCHVPNALLLLASSNYSYLLKNASKERIPQ